MVSSIHVHVLHLMYYLLLQECRLYGLRKVLTTVTWVPMLAGSYDVRVCINGSVAGKAL